MDRLALGLEALAFGDPEPVLFVHHGQLKVLEDDVVLEKGVSPDCDLNCAASQIPELVMTSGALVPTGQKDGLYSLHGKGFRQGFKVLAGENLGGRHQG